MQSKSFTSQDKRPRRPLLQAAKGMLAVAFLGGCRLGESHPDYAPPLDDAGSDASDAGHDAAQDAGSDAARGDAGEDSGAIDAGDAG